MTARTILVIGGGPAGVFAAIEAKRIDPAATVTLLTDEHCEPYEKPPLSKAVLTGKKRAHEAPIAGPKGLAGHGVAIATHASVTAIERDARAVVLADGRRLPYDALVIATGSLVRQVPSLPLGMARVHYLRNAAHAHALEGRLKAAAHLVVVGGGLIGLEVAASAAELGIKTTVIEMASRILARVCDEETGAIVEAAHRAHGVDLRLGASIATVTPQNDGRVALTLADGDTIIADEIVVGAGATPDDALAAAAGLVTDAGILVDAQCRTSDPAIFAAGDCARFPGPHGLTRLEDWRHAQDQGSVAGRNAAGKADAYDTVPSFWSEQYDLYLQGVGWATSPRDKTIRRPLQGKAVLAIHWADGVATAALGVNAQRELATIRRLIERRIPVDPAAFADPAVPLAGLLKAKA